VAALVDRERLASIAYFGTSSPRVGFASPHSPYASGVTPGSAYDPGEATRLLEEMGLRDRDDDGIRDDAGGNAVTVTMLVQDNNVRRARAAAIISDEMRRVGLDASVEAVPYEQIVRTLTTTYDHQMVLLGFTGSGDLVDSGNVIPSSAPLHISYPSQETPHYEWERELDALYEELLATAREPEIKEICSRIESVFLEELPWIYLVSQHAFAAAREPYGNLVRRTIGSGTFVVGRLFVR
jgi:peptide/nickel transport system substrate-binding protein